jgi:hypothetical protein
MDVTRGRQKARRISLRLLLPGREARPVEIVPVKPMGPEQGTNNARRVRFGKATLQAFPLLASMWASDDK